MFFTQEDYLKIEKWLKARAVKDSQFPELIDYDQPNPDDYFVILQGNKTNAKVKVTKAFLHIYNRLQNRPILRGSGNYSLITDNKWTTRPNEASGEGSIAIGLGNNKASKYLSVAIGQNNTVDSQFSWGLGSDNNIQSVDGYNKVFGNNNIINRGSRNYIIGDNNNLQYSSYNYVFGLNNHISDSNSSAVIIGSDNYGSDGGSSIYIGKGLKGTTNDGIASVNLGQYNINVPGNNYLFTIGNGKNDNRSNIFAIGYDGNIHIQNIGSKTLQAYLKDLETSKQNKLIAGAGIEISSNNTISCTLDPVIFVVVDTLPLVPEDANINKIHLVKDTTVSGNLYSEYLYVNNTWEKLGDFQPSIDLSDFVDLTSEQTITAEKTFSGGINMNNTRIHKVKIPAMYDDAANKQYVDDTVSLANNAVQTTWSELKSLRDVGKLVPGTQYRITDYTCTTTQSGTKSARHVFDIIVTTDDESTLNEVARAVKHDGDEYFANSDLSAWKIWYCIDNDTNRFAWADTENGKGVIYRMIDEFANDCPYDFKNIQFYRQWNEDKQLWCTIPDGNTGVPCYTFSSNGDSSTAEFTDMSLSISNNVYSNVIKEYINIGKQTLNNICFFGNSCNSNSFENDCYFNSFGTGCDTNTFGCRCNTNSFGYGCSFNAFGNKFEYNAFGNYCLDNSFGNDCSYNSLDDTCFGNSFGNSCVYNSIGESCSYNSFGNGCSYIKFASDSAATTKYAYYQNNHFGDGCEYIVFTGAESVSNASEIHNYNFSQGLQGTANNYLIVEGKRNRAYETKVAKNSSGELKIYCEADLIL